MSIEITTAQLSIVGGSWQEMPETLAILAQGASRGTLYLCTDVIGDSPDRETLAREIIQTANREYGGSRGSVTLALTQAIRSVNDFFYNQNLSKPREARCIAGLTAAVLRGDDLYIAQGGPGLVCHIRGLASTRRPEISPWYIANEPIGDFPTPGAVPLGLRNDYTPDLYFFKLEGRGFGLIATRSLAQLFSEEELIDAVANGPVDAIIENIEDIAGSADLSVIAIQYGRGSEVALPNIALPDSEPAEPQPAQSLSWLGRLRQAPPEDEIEMENEEAEPVLEQAVAPPAPTPEELAAIRLREERRRERRAKFNANLLGIASGAIRGIAGVASRVNLKPIGNAADRAVASLFWTVAHLISAIIPSTSKDDPGKASSPRIKTAWRFAALLFPLLMIALGVGSWFQYQREAERDRALQFAQLLDQTSTALKSADALVRTEKASARDYAQRALRLADQARTADPNSAPARSIYLQAQELIDQIDGVAFLLYVPNYANYSDSKAKPSRIVLHLPDIYVLDRGTNRIYRYKIDDVGASVQAVNVEGTILKGGDKVADRTVGELIDMMWIEAGRLVALDRNGVFWQYDPRGSWVSRAATDGNKWTRVNLASASSNNLYLVDSSTSQILRNAQAGDAWTNSTPFLATGVTADLSSVVDIAVDTEVWLLQKDGKILRFNQGRQVEYALRDLEIPLSNPVAISISSTSVYIADAGNQRIVQFDRASGKFARQFKPGGNYREVFSALKTMAADEAGRKFFVINASTAYFATIPQ